eukprot:6183999-Pleurochrysis_carterae.AAC.2
MTRQVVGNSAYIVRNTSFGARAPGTTQRMILLPTAHSEIERAADASESAHGTPPQVLRSSQ